MTEDWAVAVELNPSSFGADCRAPPFVTDDNSVNREKQFSE